MKVTYTLKVVRGTFKSDKYHGFESIEKVDEFINKERTETYKGETCAALVAPMTMEIWKISGRKREKVGER